MAGIMPTIRMKYCICPWDMGHWCFALSIPSPGYARDGTVDKTDDLRPILPVKSFLIKNISSVISVRQTS